MLYIIYTFSQKIMSVIYYNYDIVNYNNYNISIIISHIVVLTILYVQHYI